MATYTVAAATGNAATDTANIQAQLTNAAGDQHSRVFIPAGLYRINATLRVSSYTEIYGTTGTILKLIDNCPGWMATANGSYVLHQGYGYAYPMIGQISGYGHALTDVKIHDFEIDGNEANQSNPGWDKRGGHGCYMLIAFRGTSGAAKVNNVDVYNMNLHDCVAEGLRVSWGTNINYYNNIGNNLQHTCVMYEEVNGGTIHNNIANQCVCAGDRLDNCQNIQIYNEKITPYKGTSTFGNKNSFGEYYSDTAIQIGNASGLVSATSNIVVHDCDLRSGETGIWIDDEKGIISTQTVNIYNNKIQGGYIRTSASIFRSGGIGISGWNDGITIEYNLISACSWAGVVMGKPSGSTSTHKITINNNNITGTLKGYGIINSKPALVTLIINGNYFDNNPSGNTSGCTATNSVTSPNGAKPGTTPTQTVTSITVGQDSALASASYYYCNPASQNAGTVLNNAIIAASALSTVGNPATVFIKEATNPYYIDTHVLGKSNVNVIGEGISKVTLKLKSGLSGGSAYPPGWGNDSGVSAAGAMLMLMSVSNVRVSGFTLDGSWDDLYASRYPSRGQGYFTEITVNGSTNIIIDTIKFIRGDNDGVLAGTTAGIEVMNCEFNTIGHDGAAFKSCSSVSVHHNKFAMRTNSGIRFDTSPSSLAFCNEFWTSLGGGSGIELENNVANCLIYNNYFHDISGAGGNYGAVGYHGMPSGELPTGSGVQVYKNVMISCAYSTDVMPAGYTFVNNLYINAPITATNYGTHTPNVTSLTGLMKNGTDHAGNVYYSGGVVVYGIDPAIVLVLPNTPAVTPVTPVIPPYTPNVPSRYIPHSRAARETLADFFYTVYTGQTNPNILNEITGYVNQYPLIWNNFSADTSRSIAQNKSPSVDGWNLGDFGLEGSTITVDCLTFSVYDRWKELAAWESRTPTIFEPGGIYEGWFLSGIPGRVSSQLRLSEIVPEGYTPYSLMFLVDNPVFQSKIERIRTRHIIENWQQWSSGDAPTGNQLKNPSFDSWSGATPTTISIPSQFYTSEGYQFRTSDGKPFYTVDSDIQETVIDQAPDWWSYIAPGQSQEGDIVEDGAFALCIRGDGTTADVGSISQPISCESGINYIISAYGAAYGITQGQGIIDVYADGAVKGQLRWGENGDYTKQEALIRFDVTPSNTYIVVHATGTPNIGAFFYFDNVYFTKASDQEQVSTGSDIITLGEVDTIPDFIVSCTVSPSSSVDTTQDVPGTQQVKTNFNGATSAATTTIYSTDSTSYVLKLTTTLPTLPNSGKYRFDNISSQLATAIAGNTASLKVTIQATSLYSGVETQLAEWTSTQTYQSKTTNLTGLVSANEQVVIRYYLKTSVDTSTAYAKLIGLKYTPLTPSTNYGDVAGQQVSFTYDPANYYTSSETSFNADSKQWEAILLALPAGQTYRLDGLSCMISKRTSGMAYLQVTAQATGWEGGVESVIIGPWSTGSQTAVAKSATFNKTNFGNGPVTLRWYLRSSDANKAVCSKMTYKYSPQVSQAPPDPVATTTTVSVYNVADPLTVLDMVNNLLPNCRVAINGDYSGTFEYSDSLKDDTYKDVLASSAGLTYSAANRTLTITPTTGFIGFKFDVKYPVTGIPFLQLFVVSGCPTINISVDGETGYSIDGNTTTDLINTVVYRELDSLANLQLDSETVYYIEILPATATPLVIGSIYHYADLITMDAVRPKVFATGEANTFSAIISGNPVDLTIRYRDNNRVI